MITQLEHIWEILGILGIKLYLLKHNITLGIIQPEIFQQYFARWNQSPHLDMSGAIPLFIYSHLRYLLLLLVLLPIFCALTSIVVNELANIVWRRGSYKTLFSPSSHSKRFVVTSLHFTELAHNCLCRISTLRTLKYFCINHGEQSFF